VKIVCNTEKICIFVLGNHAIICLTHVNLYHIDEENYY